MATPDTAYGRRFRGHAATFFAPHVLLVMLALALSLWLLTWPRGGTLATVERLVLAGVLVVVPLGLSHLDDLRPRWRHVLAWLHPPAAAAAVLAVWLPTGRVAGLVAALWWLMTLVIAMSALDALIIHRRTTLANHVRQLACLYVPVGGAWWVASRAGMTPLDFGEPIVALTAAHFHFAGFATPLLAAAVLDRLFDAPPLGVRVLVVIVVSAPPVLALGITFSPLLEVLSACVMALGMLGVAGVIGFRAHRLDTLWQRVLLRVAGATLWITMGCAAWYAVGEFAAMDTISIPAMARWHGQLNVFGFAIPGLWALRQPLPSKPRS